MVGVNYAQISNCFAIAQIESTERTGFYTDYAGGFVGKSTAIISNSGCIADINCPNYMNAIGGFAGVSLFSQYKPSGIIKNCYCQSNIDANECPQIGGFIGSNGDSQGNCIIENSYSATTINIDDYSIDIGGFGGANYDSQISTVPL